MIACGALNKIIELKLPFSALGFNPNDEVRLFLEIRREGSLLERWPNQMPISFDVPDENFEAVMWSA